MRHFDRWPFKRSFTVFSLQLYWLMCYWRNVHFGGHASWLKLLVGAASVDESSKMTLAQQLTMKQ